MTELNLATRRTAIGALVGLGAIAAFAPARTVAQTAIALPERPLVLSRRIERSLSDGNSLRVDRTWKVRFAEQGQGIAITGEQVDVAVDAPASLAPIAAVEEARPTAGMWPILLTGSGLIMVTGSRTREQDFAEAVRVAQDLIGRRAIPASRADAEMQFFADLQHAGSSLLDRLPDDLFFPTVGPLHEVRSLDLPGGVKGHFEVSYEAVAVPGKGWLDRAERKVITRVGSSEQSAREVWTLTEI